MSSFARVHQTLRVTAAMEAGIADHVRSIEECEVTRMSVLGRIGLPQLVVLFLAILLVWAIFHRRGPFSN